MGAVGIHDHARESSMPYLSDDRLRLKLHVDFSAMGVTLRPGFYQYRSKPVAWTGGSLNLLSPDLRPTTSGHWAWAVIGINPTVTPVALVAVAGTSQATTLPLSVTQIADVGFNWDAHIPVCAVKLRNGATALSEWDFEALLHMAYVYGAHVTPDRMLTRDGDVLMRGGKVLWR